MRARIRSSRWTGPLAGHPGCPCSTRQTPHLLPFTLHHEGRPRQPDSCGCGFGASWLRPGARRPGLRFPRSGILGRLVTLVKTLVHGSREVPGPASCVRSAGGRDGVGSSAGSFVLPSDSQHRQERALLGKPAFTLAPPQGGFHLRSSPSRKDALSPRGGCPVLSPAASLTVQPQRVTLRLLVCSCRAGPAHFPDTEGEILIAPPHLPLS